MFPISIGYHVNYLELDCIKGSIDNGDSQFDLRDFTELLVLLANVKRESLESALSDKKEPHLTNYLIILEQKLVYSTDSGGGRYVAKSGWANLLKRKYFYGKS